MEWLVLLHVLGAVFGLGPAYAFPFILRKTASAAEMEKSLALVTRLETFPKIFGTIAVLSGLALFWLGSYGAFMQVWIFGTLLVYVAIEVLIIGFLAPAVKKLLASLAGLDGKAREDVPSSVSAMYARVRNLHLWASVLSLVIIAFMVLKPH
jgi:uncharacterized membrane protein